TPTICDPRRDGKLSPAGWSLDYETWQGVRTFDPAVGQWNSPDAYAGDVHDPMSQKPFMWNRNNPYAYSDPSGYDTIYYYARNVGAGTLVDGIFVHIFISVHRDDGSVKRYSFGPSDSTNPG